MLTVAVTEGFEPLKVRAGTAANQRITWPGDRWVNSKWTTAENMAGPGRAAIRALADRCQLEGGDLSRALIRDFVTVDPEPIPLLVASMAFGFGTISYGPYRLSRMLSTPNIERRIQDAVTSVRSGIEAGYATLGRRHPSHVSQMAGSMGSKLLYFAAEQSAEPMPLIHDENVWRALTVVENPPEPCFNPKGGYTPASYLAYCQWAHELTRDRDVSAEDLEVVLFERGKGL